jgi:hypothetical protein
MFAEAMAEHSKMSKQPTAADGSVISAGIGCVYAVSGRRDEALKIVDYLKDLAKERYIDPYNIADNLFRFRRQGRGSLLVESRYRAALLWHGFSQVRSVP